MKGLSRKDVLIIVNRYIGVSGGYLGDFSYRTHADFYPEYCDLDINPDGIEGTTRERFIEILSTAALGQQAKIIRGVLERFPAEAEDAPSTRTTELRHKLEALARRLEDGPQVPAPSVPVQAESLQRALADAERLIETSGATSAVDRVHTALHGYLRVVCNEAAIPVAEDATLAALLKAARQQHAALQPEGPRASDITKVLRSLSAVVDALGPVRNKASLAHPQPALLEPPEAMLVVHAARTIIHYIRARLASFQAANKDRTKEATT